MAEDYQSQVVLSKEAYYTLGAPLFVENGEKEALWEGTEFYYDSAGYVVEAAFRKQAQWKLFVMRLDFLRRAFARIGEKMRWFFM